MLRYLHLFSMLLLPVFTQALELDVDHYALNSHPQWTWAIESLYEHPLKGDEKILDIGCGDGKISAHLASIVSEGSVLGIDPCATAVHYATERRQCSNLSFQLGDGQNFCLDQDFDLITAFCSVHWMADKEGFLSCARTHLKPGGRLFIVGPDRENYRDLLEDAGFVIDVEDYVRTTIVMESRQTMKDWLQAIRSDLDDEALEEATDRIIALCKQIYPQAGDGRIYAFPHRYVVSARRLD